MVKYINMISNYGTETIDELDSNNFEYRHEFRAELKRLLAEYRMSGHNAWISSRACKEWTEQPVPEKLMADLK